MLSSLDMFVDAILLPTDDTDTRELCRRFQLDIVRGVSLTLEFSWSAFCQKAYKLTGKSEARETKYGQ